MKTGSPHSCCSLSGITGWLLLLLGLAVLAGGSLLALHQPRPGLDVSTRQVARLAEDSPLNLASLAVAGDEKAVAALRAQGQPGLDALLSSAPALLERMRNGTVPLEETEAAAFRLAIDKVAAQRDAHASGLYWYTDLTAAKAAAVASGRFILSLRLLGNLSDEYSCANSRFFRTVLYANSGVSRYLRENYILHWQSVRPAPVVTIDMGDG